MDFKIGNARLALALIPAVLVAGCSWEKGKVEVGFARNAPFVRALEGDDGVRPCMRFVSVTEYDSRGREREVRAFDIPPAAGCVQHLELNGAKFLTSSQAREIKQGLGRKFSIFVSGQGLEVSEDLAT